MNSRFRLSSKKLSVILAVSIAAVLIITVSVLTVALAVRSDEDAKLPPEQIEDGNKDNEKLP